MNARRGDGSRSELAPASLSAPFGLDASLAGSPAAAFTTGRRIAARLLAIASLGLLVGWFLFTGLRGLDFGTHIDEGWAQLAPLRKSLETWTFLPSFYLYPSLNYWLNLSGLVPHLIRLMAAGERGASLASHLFGVVDTDSFKLELRAIRLVLSSLGIVWLYLFVLKWRKSWLEALLSAAILGLSWEVGYHARWIAPDDVVMQFAAMTILFVGMAVLEPRRAVWGWLGAVSAALATGTKYTAGLLILPVLLVVGWQWTKNRPATRIWMSLLRTVLIFGVTYLVTTPGTVLQPWHFLRDIRLESLIYGEAGHVGHTVWPGTNHLSLMAEYLALVLFSHYPIAAALLAAFAVPGVIFLFRESRILCLALLLFPVTYVGFLATQKVMFPRHLLGLAPFLALFAGRGITGLFAAWRSTAFHLGLAGTVGAALALNAYWLGYAATTIVDRGSNRFLAEAAAFVARHPDTRFLATPAVAAGIQSTGVGLPGNLALVPENDVEYVLVYASEATGLLDWTANLYDLTVRTFGPQMDNFNYYPAEYGDDQILLMTYSRACQAGVNYVKPVCPGLEWNSLLKSRPPTHPVRYPPAL